MAARSQVDEAAPSDGDPVGRRVALFMAVLDAAIEQMHPLTAEQQSFLRSQHEAIKMVLSIESDMLKREALGRRRQVDTLDLDAARAEIHRRLARFKAAVQR